MHLKIIPAAVVFFLLLTIKSVKAQYEFPGSPVILNYTSENYDAGTENYAIIAGLSGSLYFANDAGLLVYNGRSWSLNTLPNHSKVQAILSFENKIYVGGNNEIGYFIKDQNGLYQYTDLRGQLESVGLDFREIKGIFSYDKTIFIQTEKHLVQLEQDQYQNHQSLSPDAYITKAEEKLLYFSESYGLAIYVAGKFRKINGSEVIMNERIRSIISFKPGQLLLSNEDGAIFHYDGEHFELWKSGKTGYLKQHRLKCAVKISDALFAFGTYSGGIVLMDDQARILSVINHSKGLPNERIYALYPDKSQNLWVGTKNGISLVKTHSPIYLLELDAFNGNPGNRIYPINETLYLSSHDKLFYFDLARFNTNEKNLNPTHIDGLIGEDYTIKSVSNKTWVSDDRGIYELENGNIRLVVSVKKPLDFEKLASKEQFIVGDQNGLSLYEKIGQNWNFSNVIDTSIGPTHKLHEDSYGRLWFNSLYKGVGQLVYNDQFDNYERKNISDQQVFNDFFTLGNELILSNNEGFFTYNAESEEIERFYDLDEYFNRGARILALKEDPGGHIWFITDQEVGVLKVTDSGLRKEINKISFPSIQRKMLKSKAFINPYAKGKAFVNSAFGFIHLHLDHFIGVEAPEIIISSVVSMNPQSRSSYTDLTTRESEQDTSSQKDVLSSFTVPNNTLRFYFTSSTSNQAGDVVFSSKMEGLEEEWSSWTPESERLFTSLPSGSYAFLVKARTANNMESKPMRFSFRIVRQWYYSIPALISYGLLLAMSIILINRRQLKKVKTEAGLLKTEQENLEEKIKEITHINTKQDRRIKEDNLFSTLKPHLQTVDSFQEIQKRIEKIIPEAHDKILQHELKKINKFINSKLRFEKDWKRFSDDFDVLHNDLLKRLAEAYPDLTEKDLRMCAYIQMDLKSKEIAPLMNVTVRGVEVSRYRLRKKLNLENDISLKEFVQEF